MDRHSFAKKKPRLAPGREVLLNRQSKNIDSSPVTATLERANPLSVEVISAIEKELEERFRKWATDLVTDPRWGQYRSRWLQLKSRTQQNTELRVIIGLFAHEYRKLLEAMVVEFSKEFGEASWRFGVAKNVDPSKVLQLACAFTKRFTEGEYSVPEHGFFMLEPSFARSRDDFQEVVATDFQLANSLSFLFKDAEVQLGSESVQREYDKHLEGWQSRSAERAKNILASRIADVESGPPKPLTEREQRIWRVIQRNITGRQYCRELDSAGVRPRKTGAWKDGPGTYLGAFDEGGKARQRVQDEKTKVRRKAEQLEQY